MTILPFRPPWKDKSLSPETREALLVAADWERALNNLLDNPRVGMRLTSTEPGGRFFSDRAERGDG